MTRYKTTTGREFTLSYLTLEEWAEAMRLALVRLGCSEQYAAQSAALIRSAVRR